MWMILCINIITDNENKKDRMIDIYSCLPVLLLICFILFMISS